MEGRKEGRKEARKENNGRKEGRKEEGKDGMMEGWKVGRKHERREGRKVLPSFHDKKKEASKYRGDNVLSTADGIFDLCFESQRKVKCRGGEGRRGR